MKENKRQSKKCINCNELFYRESFHTDYTWNKKRYCSYQCSGEYNTKRATYKNTKLGIRERLTKLEQEVRKLGGKL